MIAIYVRVSTTEQAQNGHSIDEQIDRLQKYCEALGMQKPKVYNDAGFTGSNIDRPALQTLISDVKSHNVERVLVYKLDRLSRSQKDTLMLIEDIFLKNGCDFASISENFDTSTPLGRAMIGILAVFAQLEREQIKERMTMGREARAKQGKYAGSWKLPIGYNYINGELVLDDYEKDLVRQIFEDYASGISINGIANKLNEAGLFHKYGKWRAETVRSILSKKTYLGYVSFGGEWFRGTHTPIVDAELFNKVQKMRNKSILETPYGTKGKAISYLGGLVVCKRCGKKYFKYVRSSTTKGKKYSYDYYCCFGRYPKKGRATCQNTNWKMQELDELIFAEIRKLNFESIQPKTSENTSSIVKRINNLDKQLERIMTVYTLGGMPLEIIQKKIHEVNDQKAKLEKLKELDTQTTVREAKKVVGSFDKILKKGTLEDARSALKTLIDHIEVDGENVYIFWAFE